MDSKQLGRVAGTPNQGETLARMCEDIRRRGLQATHFLVVFFRWGKEIPKSCKTKFRQMFFKFMTMKVVVELAEDDSVYVQWKSPNLKTSSMYYTTSRFDEAYIRQLSTKALKNAYHEARKAAGLSDTEVALNSIVSKNLDFVIDINNGANQSNVCVGRVPNDLAEIELEAEEVDEEDEEIDVEIDEEIDLSPVSSATPPPSTPLSPIHLSIPTSPSLSSSPSSSSPSLSPSPLSSPSLSPFPSSSPSSFDEENDENTPNIERGREKRGGRKRKEREESQTPPTPPKRRYPSRACSSRAIPRDSYSPASHYRDSRSHIPTSSSNARSRSSHSHDSRSRIPSSPVVSSPDFHSRDSRSSCVSSSRAMNSCASSSSKEQRKISNFFNQK